MIINKKQIKEEIKTNLENMKKINSLEEYIKYDTSLCHLIDIYEILSSSVSLYRIPRNKNYELQEIGKFDYLSILLEEFKRNNEIHKEYSKRIIDIYSKIDLKNLSIPKTKLKKEDRIDIIRDFLNSYDSNMYELFMNMEGYIDMDTKKLKKTDFTCYIPILKNSYILINNHGSVDDLATLIHELGHAYTYRLFNNESLDRFYSFNNNYLTETFSLFLEILFIDYLKKNNINKEDAILSENMYLKYIENRFKKVLELCKMDKIDKIVSKDETILINALIYSYGATTGIELCEHYKEDPKYTKENIRFFLSSLGKYSSEELLDILKIKEEDLHSCKTLIKRLNNHKKEIQFNKL